MIKLLQAKYCLNPKEIKPDANVILRFMTTYQTEIKEGEVQTADGVVILPQMYKGSKLAHGDKIQVLARKLEDERYEGEIKKISQRMFWQFKQYLHILSNPQTQPPQRIAKQVQQSFFDNQKKQ